MELVFFSGLLGAFWAGAAWATRPNRAIDLRIMSRLKSKGNASG
jgi:hypothetical protein